MLSGTHSITVNYIHVHVQLCRWCMACACTRRHYRNRDFFFLQSTKLTSASLLLLRFFQVHSTRKRVLRSASLGYFARRLVQYSCQLFEGVCDALVGLARDEMLEFKVVGSCERLCCRLVYLGFEIDLVPDEHLNCRGSKVLCVFDPLVQVVQGRGF